MKKVKGAVRVIMVVVREEGGSMRGVRTEKRADMGIYIVCGGGELKPC